MHRAPALPTPCGPVTQALFDYLHLEAGELPPLQDVAAGADDPLADRDLQLALYCCYELHYRGFDLADDFEWDESVLRFRRQLEGRFEQSLRETLSDRPGRAAADLEAIIASGADGPSPSAYMAEHGTVEQFREFAIHRSLYQLKEADAHTWAIPRYIGRSRSALIEIQMDEYGNGVPGQAHAELFADTMDELGLDTTYGRYIDDVGAETLVTTNLISWFGLHRRLLPCLLGHLAVFEMTSTGPMARYAAACDRLGLPARARHFYDVHVIADEHHGPLAAQHLVGDYLAEHPEATPLVMWGARALMLVEARLAAHLVDSWTSGCSSLHPATATDSGRRRHLEVVAA
jgi:hypothetical protein